LTFNPSEFAKEHARGGRQRERYADKSGASGARLLHAFISFTHLLPARIAEAPL